LGQRVAIYCRVSTVDQSCERQERSTLDLLNTLKELEAKRVSVITMNGLAFDLTTPHGRMLATMIAGIAEFERELIQERIRSGLASARASGKRLGPKAEIRPTLAQGHGTGLAGRELSRDRPPTRHQQEYGSRYCEAQSPGDRSRQYRSIQGGAAAFAGGEMIRHFGVMTRK
jgi:DNA invertase Pin-like site-specific DNA recombinase